MAGLFDATIVPVQTERTVSAIVSHAASILSRRNAASGITLGE